MTPTAAVSCCLSLGLVIVAGSDTPKVYFAASGDQVEIAVVSPDAAIIEQAILRAFERSYGDPLPIKDGRVFVEVPSVRSPVVMSLCAEQNTSQILAELIAYPKQDTAWSADELRIFQLDAPDWFIQWQKAVGVGAVQADLDAPGASTDSAPSYGELLIVGLAAVGEGPSDLINLAQNRGINVLALGPHWAGEPQSVEVNLTPQAMRGPLSPMKSQRWRQALAFRSIQKPHPAVMNRRIWIESAQGPRVEQLGGPNRTYGAVVSYLPWSQVLGRIDLADDLLLTILRTAAELKPQQNPLQKVAIYPLSIEAADPQRPVLAAALRATGRLKNGSTVHILDLRGRVEPDADLLRSLESLGSSLGSDTFLLILGDSAALNRWPWLRLDRDKMKIRSPSGITWLPDDALPASAGNRYRLMHTLTGMGVPLTSDDQRTEP